MTNSSDCKNLKEVVELFDDDPNFYREENFIKLEKLIINSLKRHKITCTKISQTGAEFEWDAGMFGSEVGFSLDFDFKSYFSKSEIQLMSSYMEEAREGCFF